MLKHNRKGFIKGVPARDLTDEEARKYGRERLLNSGVYYEEVQPQRVRRGKRDSDEPQPEEEAKE